MPLRVRLVSWNLHTPPLAPRRLPRLRAAGARLVHAPHADFLAFQEIWTSTWARELAAALEPAYEPLWPAGGPDHLDGSGLLTFVRRGRGWHAREVD